MNPLWSVFFKDRFRTPFSIYKMSLAEVVFLLAMTVGIGVGIEIGIGIKVGESIPAYSKNTHAETAGYYQIGRR